MIQHTSDIMKYDWKLSEQVNVNRCFIPCTNPWLNPYVTSIRRRRVDPASSDLLSGGPCLTSCSETPTDLFTESAHSCQTSCFSCTFWFYEPQTTKRTGILFWAVSCLDHQLSWLTQKSKLKFDSMNHEWILISGRAAATADMFKATSVILQLRVDFF